ncbi:MAG: MATE family efflux transporter [Gammaproteobacteria bacterium]|nr:MATE family efflux transporter [Gammaproteobacteria bacterium]
MLRYLREKSTHQQTLALAIPMILTNLTVPITGLVDTAVMGHLSEAHFLGATAVGSLIITMLMWAMGFLRMSTTGLAAQAAGKDDPLAMRQSLFNALLVALTLSAVILLTQSFIWQLATHFMQASTEVLFYAKQYFDIRIWSLPALLLRYVFVGWLLGLHRAKMPLLILVVSNLVNIALDILFVVYWNWGIEGAAWASLIADYIGLVIGLWVIVRLLRQMPLADPAQSWFEPAALWQVLALNRDIFIRTLALEAVFYVQTAVGASLGDTVLAANAVLMNFVMIMAYGLDGFANAVEAMAGKAFGARNSHAFWQAVNVSGFWSLLCSVFFTVVFALTGGWLIDLMTSIPSVNQLANDYLLYLIFIPIIAVWSYWLDGIFIGLTATAAMRNSMLVAVFLVFIPLTFTVKFIGNHGLWIAFYGFMLIRAAGLIWYLRKFNVLTADKASASAS